MEALRSLIEHLQKSPVFYSGTEFTEAVYKGFLLDNNTRLAASEIDGEIVSSTGKQIVIMSAMHM